MPSTAAFDWAGLGWRLCQYMQALVAEVRQLGRAALSESGSWRLRLGVMEAHSQELPDLRFIPKPMPWLKTFTVRRYTNLEWKKISHLQTSQSFDQSCIFLNAPSWLWALVGCPLTHMTPWLTGGKKLPHQFGFSVRIHCGGLCLWSSKRTKWYAIFANLIYLVTVCDSDYRKKIRSLHSLCLGLDWYQNIRCGNSKKDYSNCCCAQGFRLNLLECLSPASDQKGGRAMCLASKAHIPPKIGFGNKKF